jgi:hypothetical protein
MSEEHRRIAMTPRWTEEEIEVLRTLIDLEPERSARSLAQEITASGLLPGRTEVATAVKINKLRRKQKQGKEDLTVRAPTVSLAEALTRLQEIAQQNEKAKELVQKAYPLVNSFISLWLQLLDTLEISRKPEPMKYKVDAQGSVVEIEKEE